MKLEQSNSKFMMLAFHKDTHQFIGNAAVFFFKSDEDVGDMQSVLTRKPEIDLYDWVSLDLRSF